MHSVVLKSLKIHERSPSKTRLIAINYARVKFQTTLQIAKKPQTVHDINFRLKKSKIKTGDTDLVGAWTRCRCSISCIHMEMFMASSGYLKH